MAVGDVGVSLMCAQAGPGHFALSKKRREVHIFLLEFVYE